METPAQSVDPMKLRLWLILVIVVSAIVSYLSPHETIVTHLIYIGSSVCFGSFPFDRSRLRAPWANRVALTIAGILMIMGGYGLILDLEVWNPSRQVQSHLGYLIQGMGGFLLGCVFALFASGELMGKKIEKDDMGKTLDDGPKHAGPCCVSCRSPIEAGAILCPKCGWTQPS
jgi:hypothetical protein